MREVECPHCGKLVPWTPESRWRPFCSERCRLVDLGQWFGEEHTIPGEPDDSQSTSVDETSEHADR
ncbi:DNA gyrase inhibitor YacG [Thioalkalivibrio sp. XN8]|nr:DNA gyrase inhibitor YacG [Thioalkalivibrio sp. XN8]NGP52159.1 DNA gyrase inhibitor YacG [Thioalkalivibrio sp. XN8]